MFFQPVPHTSTYTQMAQAVGVDFIRAYTSSTKTYHRIKLYGAHPRHAARLQKLFPEAKVKANSNFRGDNTPEFWPCLPSVVLFFPR